MQREQTFLPQATQGHVLCCTCGSPILPNSSNMCISCIRSQVDVTEGIQKQVTVLWCKECGRYLQPPKHWLRADPESKELLTYCLKKIKGLQKVKLVDAGFIWTEPHSRRLKVKVTVQAEVFSGAILQQTFVVDYVVETHMCPDCEKRNTNPNTWVAAVQVRQHTEHKRTFLYLEQLILKHGADANCQNIKSIHEGVDFYFSNRAHAQKFVDFLQSVVPVRFRQDKQLVSHNTHTSTYNYKYTFSVEIVPICKDDLICLPSKMAASHGNTAPIVLCTRVTNVISLTDPNTLRTINIDSTAYWRHPFRPIMTAKQLEQFVVLDIDGSESSSDRHVLADAQVAKAADLGSNDRQHLARTHLGHLLRAGDTALGYDLTTAQLSEPDLDRYLEKGMDLQDVILVRKSYEEKRRRRHARGHRRAWQLKRMVVDTPDEASTRGRSRHGPPKEVEHERFLQELEEDPQMRSKIALFRRKEEGGPGPMGDESSDDDGLPDVPLEELLDDLSALQIADAEMEGAD